MPYREEQTALTYSADELFGVVANIRDYPSLLCPAVLSRHRSACRVDDVRLNAVGQQPPRQPKLVASRLIGEDDPPITNRWQGFCQMLPPSGLKGKTRRCRPPLAPVLGWTPTP
jgi:hypothetical protein